MATFLGESLQEPPMYSALRGAGGSTALARAGEQVGADLHRMQRQRDAHVGLASPGRGVRRARRLGACARLARDLGVRCDSAAHLAALLAEEYRDRAVRLDVPIGIADLAALDPRGGAPLVRLADALAHLPAVLLGEREGRGVLDGRAPVVYSPADLPAVLQPGSPRVRWIRSPLAVARLVAANAPVEFLRVFEGVTDSRIEIYRVRRGGFIPTARQNSPWR